MARAGWATPEEREARVSEVVELMGSGMRMYPAADIVAARSGWARNTIVAWLREDAPEDAAMLRAAEVPARIAQLERENRELREALRQSRTGGEG